MAIKIEYPAADEAIIMTKFGPASLTELGGIPIELRRATGVTRDPECGCHFDVFRFLYSKVGLGPDVELHVLQEVAEGCTMGHSCRPRCGSVAAEYDSSDGSVEDPL